MHSFNLSGWVLLLATLLSNVVANPVTSLDPRLKKRYDSTKPKVFIISMVTTHYYMHRAASKFNEKFSSLLRAMSGTGSPNSICSHVTSPYRAFHLYIQTCIVLQTEKCAN